jgi:hypothetical protein
MTDHVRSPLGPSRAQNKPTMRPELGQTTPKVRAPRIAQPARTRREQTRCSTLGTRDTHLLHSQPRSRACARSQVGKIHSLPDNSNQPVQLDVTKANNTLETLVVPDDASSKEIGGGVVQRAISSVLAKFREAVPVLYAKLPSKFVGGKHKGRTLLQQKVTNWFSADENAGACFQDKLRNMTVEQLASGLRMVVREPLQFRNNLVAGSAGAVVYDELVAFSMMLGYAEEMKRDAYLLRVHERLVADPASVAVTMTNKLTPEELASCMAAAKALDERLTAVECDAKKLRKRVAKTEGAIESLQAQQGRQAKSIASAKNIALGAHSRVEKLEGMVAVLTEQMLDAQEAIRVAEMEKNRRASEDAKRRFNDFKQQLEQVKPRCGTQHASAWEGRAHCPPGSLFSPCDPPCPASLLASLPRQRTSSARRPSVRRPTSTRST